MHKLDPVEEAKSLFSEAKNWSVWRWLIEKKRARTTADTAWAALEAYEEKVQAGWNEEWRQAYGHPRSKIFAALPAELKTALEKGFAQSGPVLIEVPIERGSEVSPWPYLHPNL